MRKLAVIAIAAVVLLVGVTAIFTSPGSDEPSRGNVTKPASEPAEATYLVTSGRIIGAGTGPVADGYRAGNIYCSGETACSFIVPPGTESLEATFVMDPVAASASIGIRDPDGDATWSSQGNVIIDGPRSGEYSIRASPLGPGDVVYGALIQLTPENGTSPQPPVWMVGRELPARSWCSHGCSFTIDEPGTVFWYIYGEGAGGTAILTHESGETVEVPHKDVGDLPLPGTWTVQVDSVPVDQAWWLRAG